MVKLTLLCAAICVSISQCTVLDSKDVTPKRIARSPCYTCGRQLDFPPPPSLVLPPPPPPAGPPPPPVFQTENWSGLARSADGLQNAVFTGAAAAAKQGAQASGEAFSLASSSVNGVGTGLLTRQAGIESASDTTGAKHEISSDIRGDEISKEGNGYGGYDRGSYKESPSYHSDQLQQTNSNPGRFRSDSSLGHITGDISGTNHQGYGVGISVENGRSENERYDNPGAQQVQTQGFGSEPSGGQSGYSRSNGEISNGGAGYQKYSQGVSGDNGYGKHGGSYISDGQRNQPEFSSSSASQSGTNDRDNSGSNYGRFGGNYGSGKANYGSEKGNFGYQQSSQGLQSENSGLTPAGAQIGSDAGQQLQTSGFGSSSQSNFEKVGNTQFPSSNQAQFLQGRDNGLQAGVSGSSNGDAQTALSGALNLASQGLQTATQAGCSTCGKSSYALSNAKSRSGSAVAVSIGG